MLLVLVSLRSENIKLCIKYCPSNEDVCLSRTSFILELSILCNCLFILMRILTITRLELTGEAIDIIFALGSAGFEAEMVFEKQKEMVYAFVNSVDTANVRYAMIEYAENATLQADFNEYKEKYDFKEFVDSVKRIGEGLGLDKALQRAAVVFENSGRASAKRVLVVFTNAQSKARSQDLQKHSRELQESGVKVVVVAIGTDVSDEELSNIQGEPVVRTQPHDDVNVIVKSVASNVLATEPDLGPGNVE